MPIVKSDTKHVRVRADSLLVHPNAQRRLIPARVSFLTETMDLDGLGTFVGVEKKNNIYIMDGQHRLSALMACGFGEWIVDVKVYHDLTPARESQIWLMLQNRTPVNTFEKFKQEIRARRPEALAVEKLARKHSLSVVATTRDGGIACVNRLKQIIVKNGEPVADTTLAVITKAFGYKKDAFDQIVVGGIAAVVAEYNGALDLDILTVKLSKTSGGATYIISHARSTAATFKWQIARAAAEVIVGIYNAGRRANPLPEFKTRMQRKEKPKGKAQKS